MSCSLGEGMIGHGPVPPALPSSRAKKDAQTLAELTTLGVGGAITSLVQAHSEAEIVAAVREADEHHLPVLVVGGGSNILASDEPFPGVVIRDMRHEIVTTMDDGCGGGQMSVTAGSPWDDVVVYAIEHEWMGLEALSGIPGSAGAAPVQNIGAYGQEVAETISSLRVYDRLEQRITTLFLSDLDFGYRHSVLKESMTNGPWGPSPRWIVLQVNFHTRRATLSAPVKYGELARTLGIELGGRAPATEVRQAVLELRRSKSMVLDDNNRNTYSAGSFFTNPVLTLDQAHRLPGDAPQFPVTNHATINQIGGQGQVVPGLVKTSAAWLITHAGFDKGFQISSTASLSTDHCLAVTNRGNASAQDIIDLARVVRDGVREAFGVTLVPEPVFVGLSLD
ncbi:UDP-N-acetylmuramate dehydrogenase [Arcanobacterium pinnipediorum]|uniref:UDP-N-acetylenolpyruvoylglucosamine reductase n=1 Tax=Arcanobacterium pinnipediorum TaxID=1503041 RepID=A0ABY5AFY9_9ACTO|nr:UDP-N-acetylmuramate dehydrogenase [Arcanobacterium pinnipediorum]USR79114.1 UDP-N-acetylmuramate dehydrogenase [Arcanobacterium pinnipediorum]